MGSVKNQVITDQYALYNQDCVQVASNLADDSIDYQIFSPPFASLYTYSDDDLDMGNVKNDAEFYEHYKYLIKEQFRITKPGRNVSFHCMNLPSSKSRDGFIGIKDFRGDLIKAYQEAGFIYHSEVVIWKCPVIAMTRTHALGLLHAQIKKDSAMSRMGLPDYVVTMRKPGENTRPVVGEFKYYCGENPPAGFKRHEYDDGRVIYLPGDSGTSVDVWQKYASPIWDDINQTNTLNFTEGRHEDDERHICPLQLDVIERCIQLWSLPDDVIFTPFLGIGSEAYMAVKMGRKAIGSELKESYFNLAARNVLQATKSQYEMFA
jgi:DNA modification methylase